MYRLSYWVIFLAGAGLIALTHVTLSVPDQADLLESGKAIVNELGVAFLIAAIVILTVEKRAKREFIEEVADNLMQAVFRRQWPPELRDLVMRTLVEPRLYRDEYTLRLTLRPTEKAGAVEFLARHSYRIRNLTDDEHPYELNLGKVGTARAPKVHLNDELVSVETQGKRQIVLVAGRRTTYDVRRVAGRTKVVVPVSKGNSLQVMVDRSERVKSRDTKTYMNEIVSTGISIAAVGGTKRDFSVRLSTSIPGSLEGGATTNRDDELEWKVGPILVGQTIMLHWGPLSRDR